MVWSQLANAQLTQNIEYSIDYRVIFEEPNQTKLLIGILKKSQKKCW